MTCAQRLSASRIISVLSGQDAAQPAAVVLNAFRHHGLYRRNQRRGARSGVYLCSTPFGITDYIGSRPAPPHSRPAAGAQRLSASRIISVVVLSFIAAITMCSTPFGITDYIGRDAGQGGGAGAAVLNAFRHHGLYRWCRRCAPGPITMTTCAQRLSASRIISARHAAAIGSGGIWCSTPFGITDYIGRFRLTAEDAP